jgi:hypothetical protein
MDLYLYLKFQARTQIDQDGTGARVYAYAYKIHTGRHTGQHLHEIIWYATFINHFLVRFLELTSIGVI